MIPLIAADLVVAYCAGVAFTAGALSPFAVLAAIGVLILRPNRKPRK